jgi:stress-induced morphogen
VVEPTAEKDRLQGELNLRIEQEQTRQSDAETDGGGHLDVGVVAVAFELQRFAERQRDVAWAQLETTTADLRAAQDEIRALRVQLRSVEDNSAREAEELEALRRKVAEEQVFGTKHPGWPPMLRE